MLSVLQQRELVFQKGFKMILSASRRTDIPNYYSEWFINRVREGFLYVRNPMNARQVSRIDLSPEAVDCIVFWTKNPAQMIDKLGYLSDYTYYFQFTLTGYGKDIEPHLPDKREELISTFRKLSEKTGKEKVIWRYDPILINKKYTAEYHLKAFEEMAGKLSGYTEKVIISFVDLYAKIQQNMRQLDIRQMTNEEIVSLAEKMAQIASRCNLIIETCAEKINLEHAGIRHGSCIDKKLIERLSGCKLRGEKDRNQRQECGCLESVDIGAYDTCLNGCKYCYANYNDDRVKEKVKLYDEKSPLLCGYITADDRITDRKVRSLKDMQISFFD